MYCVVKRHSFVCSSNLTTHVLKIKHMLKYFASWGLQSSISTVCFCSKFTVIVSHWIDAHWVRYKKSMGTKGPSIWDFDPHIIQIHNDCFDLWIYNSIEAFRRLPKTFQLELMLEGVNRAPVWNQRDKIQLPVCCCNYITARRRRASCTAMRSLLFGAHHKGLFFSPWPSSRSM